MSRASLKKARFLPYLLAILALEVIFLLPRALPAVASTVELPQPAAAAVQPAAKPADPLYPEQWALPAMGIDALWQKTTGRADILVAVLDSGIDETHPDLAGQVLESMNFTESPTSSDVLGHGTAVAAIIAARADGAGMVGIAPGCKLLNVKVADDKGTCRPDDMAAGIIWAVDRGARIINISVQLTSSTGKLESAVRYANQNGVLIVAASGNNTPGINIYPAAYPSCLAVSALTPAQTLCPLANYTSWVDFVAPGYQVLAAGPGSTFGLKSGTSFAAPQISGLAVLLLSLNDASMDNLTSALTACSVPYEDGGISSRQINAGPLQAYLAGYAF